MSTKAGCFTACLAAFTAMTLSVNAADRTWDGEGGDGIWGTAANWSADTTPTVADWAIISTNGVPPGKRIFLRGDQTIQALGFTGSACDTIIDGEGSNTLTLTTGAVSGGSGAVKGVIACDVILGASGSWAAPDSYLSTIFCYGNVSDGGNGYGVTFAGSQNRAIVVGGHWDIGGSMTLNCRAIRIGGVYTNADESIRYGGSVTNATGVYLDGRLNDSDNETTLTIENTDAANSDRIQGNTAIGSLRSGGRIVFNGNASTPVQERVQTLDMQGGRLSITVTGKSAAVPTELIFGSVNRTSGSALALATNVAGRIIVENAVNTNGIWQPWCFFGSYYAKAEADGTIISTVNSDYLTPAPSGNDPTGLYRFTASDLTLDAPTAMWGLRWDSTSAQTINLGQNDLTIGQVP